MNTTTPDVRISGPEELIPLRQVGSRVSWLPARQDGTKLHECTLRRWGTRGFNGTKLEIVRVGSIPCTTEGALHRFFARLSGLEAAAGE